MKNKTKTIFIITIGIILGLGIPVTAKLVTDASNINLDSNKTESTNVKDSLDELYDKVDKCPNGFICAKPGSAVAVLMAKANNENIKEYASGNKKEMFTFAHEKTPQTPSLTDYRYIGNIPNNYITFNNETWRIIGIFTNSDGKQRIKIIKDTAATSSIFDGKKQNVGSSVTANGSNDWTDSQLMYALNNNLAEIKGDYSLENSVIKDKNNHIIYKMSYQPNSVDINTTSYPSTQTFAWSLSDQAISQIDRVRYYLGGIDYSIGNSSESYYRIERSKRIYANRSLYWDGYVGLMYPSDYGYTFANGVESKCFTNPWYCQPSQGETPNSSWLFKGLSEWTIMPYIGDNSFEFRIYSAGYIDNGYGGYVNASFYVRPVVYLSYDIKITSGDGSSTTPYTISK